ncbi:juvenile hormone epoxide hydrolase [Amyelois transitella]|uniref:juvenile hormone epoxide hydrolase n=1 Tax=Amyelois transitella TaxID=680683 RepID=UPI00067AE9EE|nr:juvenile hormone epoxide hydrolase [Amyelois transitella]
MSNKNKVKKENIRQDVKIQQRKRGYSAALIILPIIFGVLAAVCYSEYLELSSVPDMPRMDLDAWWGPNDTRDKQDTSIRPYRVVFSDGLLQDLQQRHERYRAETKGKKSLTGVAWTYGVHSDSLSKLFDHWLFKYKYAERVKFLNQYDHFLTNIQGLDVHFLHVKPKVQKDIKVVPLLLLHGWPGSVREFYEALPLLTNPRSGYDFVFEVIAPSLPGFAFSQASVRPGLGVPQIAVIMRNLMKRLGFPQYVVQGGDIGHAIGSNMATLFPNEVLGFHSNMLINIQKKTVLTWALGAIWPTFVEPNYTDRLYPLKNHTEFFLEQTGYSHLQSTKPDTIGIALQDSPVGLATYILDRFMIFTDRNNKYDDDGGLTNYYNMTDLLDNIMLYWATNCITTSMRVYKESVVTLELEGKLAKIPTPVPTWGLRLKNELFFQPEFTLRWKYPNLLGTTTLDHGGHFAAFELPEEFTDDVFKAVNRFLEYRQRNFVE